MAQTQDITLIYLQRRNIKTDEISMFENIHNGNLMK